jgi:hypothetical protein
MSETQTFIDSTRAQWSKVDFLPGAELLALAERIESLCAPQGGMVIPPHTHPGDEFVYVLSGIIETGRRVVLLVRSEAPRDVHGKVPT